MIITVHHIDWSLLTRDYRYEVSTGNAAVARSLWKSGQYQHVATLAARDEDDAYRLTNHIERNWQLNEEVLWSEPRARSTSCGDIICTETQTLLVAPIVFTDLHIDPQMERYWQHYREVC